MIQRATHLNYHGHARSWQLGLFLVLCGWLCLGYTHHASAQLRTGRDAASDWPTVPDVTETPDISTTPLDDEGAERLDFSDRKVNLSLDLPAGSGPWTIEEAEVSRSEERRVGRER